MNYEALEKYPVHFFASPFPLTLSFFPQCHMRIEFQSRYPLYTHGKPVGIPWNTHTHTDWNSHSYAIQKLTRSSSYVTLIKPSSSLMRSHLSLLLICFTSSLEPCSFLHHSEFLIQIIHPPLSELHLNMTE